MEREKFEIWMMEYLSDELDQKGRTAFEKFLEDHPEFRNDFKDLNQTWGQMDEMEIPEPSDKMDTEFFEMLHREMGKDDVARKGASRFQTFLESVLRPQLAYGLVLLGIGLGLGYFLNSRNPVDPVATTIVSDQETQEVREKLVLTLLEQPSANKRLQGVNEANKIAKVDETVIKALLYTLNNDPNVNVRLASIESLTNYLNNPMVREGLVQSIVKQDSPIVQVTLANLMVALQEKKSVEPFKTLMRTRELDTTVKQKLESSINQII